MPTIWLSFPYSAYTCATFATEAPGQGRVASASGGGSDASHWPLVGGGEWGSDRMGRMMLKTGGRDDASVDRSF